MNVLRLWPSWRLHVKNYQIKSKHWQGEPLTIAILTDLHAGEPYISMELLQAIVEKTNGLGADLIVLLGDFATMPHLLSNHVTVNGIAKALKGLSAPQGVFAVLGNHDWWEDFNAQRNRKGPILTEIALRENGITVLENQAIRIRREGVDYWLAGVGDQCALNDGFFRYSGVDDLEGTMAQMDDHAPKILLAHEPDIFPEVPKNVALTLSGHTHGGQVRLFGYAPIVPSRFGNRYAYGHLHENGRDIVISGGIGCSGIPIRIGSPPEITRVVIIAG